MIAPVIERPDEFKWNFVGILGSCGPRRVRAGRISPDPTLPRAVFQLSFIHVLLLVRSLTKHLFAGTPYSSSANEHSRGESRRPSGEVLWDALTQPLAVSDEI